MFEGLKARIGIGGRNRRYVDVETVADLEDISDPETTEDETWTSLRERAGEHPLLALLVGFVGLLVGGVFLFWTARLVPGLLTNQWTYISLGGAGIALFSYKKGWSGHRDRVSSWDELELDMNGEATCYKGVFLDDFPGEALGFIPIKGWRGGGHQAVPYTNGDLGAAMTESFNSYRIGDDDAAIIKLLPDEVSVTNTDWGTRVIQRTDGLEPDPDSNHATLRATHPTYDDDRANDLAEQLETVTEDYYDALDEVRSLKRRIMDLRERYNEPIEDEVQRRMDDIKEFEAIRSGRAGRSQKQQDRRDWNGVSTIGPMTNGHDAQSELEEVEEEVTPDDD